MSEFAFYIRTYYKQSSILFCVSHNVNEATFPVCKQRKVKVIYEKSPRKRYQSNLQYIYDLASLYRKTTR